MAVLACTDAFAYTEPNGVQRVLRPGDLVDENDPCVKGREAMFETVEANVHRATLRSEGKTTDDVETATNEPGRKRRGRPPGSKNRTAGAVTETPDVEGAPTGT